MGSNEFGGGTWERGGEPAPVIIRGGIGIKHIHPRNVKLLEDVHLIAVERNVHDNVIFVKRMPRGDGTFAVFAAKAKQGGNLSIHIKSNTKLKSGAETPDFL